MFYCYLHFKADTNELFYIGKGQGKRAYEIGKSRRSEQWSRVVNKHGLKIQIVDQFENEQDAFALERYLIASYKEIGIKLINKTEGGEGCTGQQLSEESKIKRSIASKARWQNEEYRNKMKISMKGKTSVKRSIASKLNWQNEEYRNKMYKVQNEEYRMKNLLQVSKLGEARRKALKCKEADIEFSDLEKARVWLISKGFIKACIGNISNALNGKRNIAYGYHWEYL